ncbi:PepSY domain-containing protein [Lentibacillus jeotgali]|uniref:PepSY domain-containing protein n=1 Tax=Lentibacillus jeotgali TaxID=558169 RepID=UPI0002627FDB|nr:PepSY domain-containing protein [Lentibacillus jeotgali]
MKKKIGIVLAVILGISALGLGMLQSSASEASPKMDRQEIEDLIKAQYPGEVTELEREKEGNRTVYEAEIHDGSNEYEIKLDGNTGEVLELDKKLAAKTDKDQNKTTNNEKKSVKAGNAQDNAAKSRDDDGDDKKDSGQDDTRMKLSQSQDSNKAETSNNTSQESAVIDTAEAEKIAKGAFSGTITELELDEDDGQLYYEIKMKSKKKEAEIEVNAYTGNIMVMEIDGNDDDDHDDHEGDDVDDHDDDDRDDN